MSSSLTALVTGLTALVTGVHASRQSASPRALSASTPFGPLAPGPRARPPPADIAHDRRGVGARRSTSRRRGSPSPGPSRRSAVGTRGLFRGGSPCNTGASHRRASPAPASNVKPRYHGGNTGASHRRASPRRPATRSLGITRGAPTSKPPARLPVARAIAPVRRRNLRLFRGAPCVPPEVHNSMSIYQGQPGRRRASAPSATRAARAVRDPRCPPGRAVEGPSPQKR
jgi:hypothetical protein